MPAHYHPNPRLLFPGEVLLPVHDHFSDGWDGYGHDPRCSGECRHGGACQMVGYYCDQRCPGCNLYLLSQARERGLVA